MSRPWYAFYPADYGRDTGHLSLIEHGAYRALMDHYYATAAPLPDDIGRLLRLCRANAPEEQAAVRYVLEEFFAVAADGWRHRRIDAEIAKAMEVSARNSFAATARQRGGSLAAAWAQPSQSQLQSPAQSPSQSPSPEKYSPAAPGFDKFWTAFPRREARAPARAAYAAALAIATPEILLAGALAYAARREGQDRQFTKLPATWLAQECWLDDAPDAPPLDAGAAARAWNGHAAGLVAEIGPAAFQSYFGLADFAPGPPARIAVGAPFLRDLIARKFSPSLRRAYGDFALEVAA